MKFGRNYRTYICIMNKMLEKLDNSTVAILKIKPYNNKN